MRSGATATASGTAVCYGTAIKPATPLTNACMRRSVPMGTFVPNLVLGAATGRLFGTLFDNMIRPGNTHGPLSNPGLYALCAAGAQLGGFTAILGYGPNAGDDSGRVVVQPRAIAARTRSL